MFDLLKDTMTPEQMIKSFSDDAQVDKSSVSAMYDYAKELHNDKKYDLFAKILLVHIIV